MEQTQSSISGSALLSSGTSATSYQNGTDSLVSEADGVEGEEACLESDSTSDGNSEALNRKLHCQDLDTTIISSHLV